MDARLLTTAVALALTTVSVPTTHVVAAPATPTSVAAHMPLLVATDVGGSNQDRAGDGAVPAAPDDPTRSPGRRFRHLVVRPVEGPVVRRFHAPSRYGPGHRGVDLAARPGTVVRAPVAGTVSFAGRVAGVIWVTVESGARRVTTGPMRTLRVRRGQTVEAGAVVGTSGSAHGAAALHLSVRLGEWYVDPLAGVRPRVSLVPLDPGRWSPTGRAVVK